MIDFNINFDSNLVNKHVYYRALWFDSFDINPMVNILYVTKYIGAKL